MVRYDFYNPNEARFIPPAAIGAAAMHPPLTPLQQITDISPNDNQDVEMGEGN